MTTILRDDRVGCLGILAIGAACMLAGCVSLDGLIASLPKWPIATPAGTNAAPPVVVTPAPDKPATVNVGGPLVDPPDKYCDKAYWANKKTQEFEECGVESELKIICRPLFWCGKSGGWLVISTLAMDHIRRDDNGVRCDDWIDGGLAYHVRGGCNDEPQADDPTPKLDAAGNRNLPKYVLIEIRKTP